MSGSWTAPPGWRKLRKAVFAAKGRLCWYCGQPAGTIDHVQPVILGGTHDLANLVPACQRCNYSRGATTGNRIRGLRHHHAPPYQPWRAARRW
jgi:5-methylcytosine-specific restriction endonuclease McrA